MGRGELLRSYNITPSGYWRQGCSLAGRDSGKVGPACFGRVLLPQCKIVHLRRTNTWINMSRDWHTDGVAKISSVWFFMSTNLQKIPVKISWHSDVWSTSYSDLSDASLDILKTMDSKQFRVLIYHCFLMRKNTAMAWKVLRGLCSIKNNHLSVVCWVPGPIDPRVIFENHWGTQ